MADGGKVVHYAVPRPAASWPHQVGVLPREADHFQDRTAVEQPEQAVVQRSTVVLCQVLAGMGGVGKTQLAAHRARQAWAGGGVDLLVWVSASTRAAVVSAYAQAASDVLGADPTNSEHAARAFLAWLEPKRSKPRCRWMVVLDDVAAPADLRGLWPPASRQGRTLITTRCRDAALIGSGRRLVPVGLFTPDEATTYLSTALAAHGRLDTPTELAALADDLGYLPLALSQAVAYVIDADLDCAAYRALLNDRAQTLAELLPDSDGLPDDQPVTVAAAWALSTDRADRLAPAGLARPMLELTAALDANGIPAPVLVSPPALAYLTERSECGARRNGGASVTAQDTLRILRVLHRLSLIDHNPRSLDRAVRVHQLIQRVTREALTSQQHDRLARAAADAVTSTWPDVEGDAAFAQVLRANTEALTVHAEDALYRADGVHNVLFHIGRSLGQAGQVQAAIDHFQRLARTAHNRLGPDHPDTLNARHNVAWGRGVAGYSAAAVAAFVELLADIERMGGPDHPDALCARYGLAHWKGTAGDSAAAVAAFVRLLADRERVLGPDHPDTLHTRCAVARWRGEAGDAAAAVADFARLLTDMERVLGPDHPSTLAIRHNVGAWTGRAGNAAGAATALARTVAVRERVLGADHPSTLFTSQCSAHWQAAAGDTDAATAVFTELLASQERVLGPDHPHTLVTRLELAACRGAAGDAPEAVTAFARLLAHQERVLGRDHAHTLYTHHCLAHWSGVAGDAAAAVVAFAHLLADRSRVLGPDHPDTVYTRECHAQWHGVVGDTAAAAELVRTLVDGETVLGPHRHRIRNTPYDFYTWGATRPFYRPGQAGPPLVRRQNPDAGVQTATDGRRGRPLRKVQGNGVCPDRFDPE
ncbi:tetratricopeptide repeat protein [Streptomyces sp. NPDC008092]|uniref:tetratricopeptide repeat protein n=1 Tax=Streptomyces sp. NPDC008092 TaxID=3364808 RepID=UPI0036E68663